MTIARRLRIVAIVPAVAALVIVAALAWSYQVATQVQQKERTSRQLANGVSEMNDLVHVYLLHRDERPVQQFRAVHADMTKLLASVRFANPVQDRLKAGVGNAVDLMGDAFGRLTSEAGRSEAAIGSGLARDAEERLTGQVLLRSREALSDVMRLEGLLDDEVSAVNRRAGWLVMALVLAVAALVTFILLPMMGGITRSLTKLQHGVDRVGAGDLGHRTGIAAGDEIGSLARTFDAMAARLQATVVSRDSLAAEMEQRTQAEEALRESEERFRSVLDNSTDAVYRLNLATGRYEYFSPASKTVYGETPEEMAAMSPDEIMERVHPDDRDEVKSALACLDEKGSCTVEFRWQAAGQGYRWLSAGMVLLRDANGRPLYRDGTVRDVTARKQAEEALQRSEERLQGVLAGMTDAYYVYDKEWRFAYLNPKALEYFGRPKEELLGKCVWDLYPETRGSRNYVEYHRAMAEGTPLHFEAESIISDRCFEVHAYPGPEGMSIYLRDVTERKRAEEALRLSEQKFAIAFAGNPAGIALTRLEDGLILDVNDTWLAMSGHSREEAIGHSSRKMRIWPSAEAAARFVAELKAKGALRGWEQEFLKKSGEAYMAELSAQVLVIGGEKVILSTMVDITQRKRAEEELRRSRDEWERTFDSVPDLIAILDCEHRIVRVNKAMADRLGVTPEQARGLHCYEAVHGTSMPPDFCPHALTCQDANEHVAELHEPRLGGDFLVSTTPVCDESGRLTGSIHVARDITARKRAEEQSAGQLAELQRWQAVMLDREDRVMELKREVNELLRRSVETVRYPSQAGEDTETR